jgi:CheY-like chemotaxis protein
LILGVVFLFAHLDNLLDNAEFESFGIHMAKLVVISEPLTGFIHELGDNWTTIGRADSNMFQLAEPSVSSRHCEVKARPDGLLVRDLSSTNGTFIAGKRISEGIVQLGQTFRLGNMDVRFEVSVAAIPKVAVLSSDAPVPRAVLPLPAKPASESASSLPKYQVLFVDDSMAFLDSFAVLCGELSGGRWQIHTAATADCALAILQEQPLDLAVLDIGMPMLDGIQLLGLIHRRYPQLKVAVLTSLATENNRAACLANGAELFLEKPISNDGIRLAYRMLNDILQWTRDQGFTGALQQINLPDIIQLQCLNRNSLILEVRNASTQGLIFIEAGQIIHATVGSREGEAAFNHLLKLTGGEFHEKAFKPPPHQTITGRWEFLLMEAARASDEETGLRQKMPPPTPPSQPVAPPSPPVSAPDPLETDHLLGDDIQIVATYDGQWKPADNGKH